jgi:hypothetical protein
LSIKVRQLGDVDGDAPCFIAGSRCITLRRPGSSSKRLPVGVALTLVTANRVMIDRLARRQISLRCSKGDDPSMFSLSVWRLRRGLARLAEAPLREFFHLQRD